MATDKNILAKGIKYLSGALPLLFLGPVIINSAFKLGIIIALAAMFLIFKGITTLVKSMFEGDKNTNT
ncbi:MAG: DUF6095 family protein [Flavobacterium sp.]|uniref:DUF6095 family protein n=1 Tax=Flavobacterium sp. TaxID=239 RepID=UPI0025C143B1|nr:DUF6095 family protein [Flavobacterium sp.]MCK6607615.1 DUF6095 family protein [Flavobacterium sp.]